MGVQLFATFAILQGILLLPASVCLARTESMRATQVRERLLADAPNGTDPEERTRLELIKSGNPITILDNIRPEELAALTGPSQEGSAAALPKGESTAWATLRIDVYIDRKEGQYLTMTDLANPKSSPFVAAVSGGRGTISEKLRGRCHTVQPNGLPPMAYSQSANMAPMPNPVFFRGRDKTRDDGGSGFVYAIHATDAVGKLGRPASNGCIRVNRENARRIQDTVKAHGGDKTVICVH